jgi:hypothetical protein
VPGREEAAPDCPRPGGGVNDWPGFSGFRYWALRGICLVPGREAAGLVDLRPRCCAGGQFALTRGRFVGARTRVHPNSGCRRAPSVQSRQAREHRRLHHPVLPEPMRLRLNSTHLPLLRRIGRKRPPSREADNNKPQQAYHAWLNSREFR